MKLRFALTFSIILSTLALPSQAGWFDWLFPPSTYTKTKYPIVMIGGFLAFDDILGIDYYYQIPDDLRDDGATVYPVNLSSFNGSEVRGLQLLDALERLEAETGHKKFNIIGHSGGATTARWAAHVDNTRIASVTSVHGSNGGVELADWVADISDTLENGGSVGTATRDTLADLVNMLGDAVEFLGGYKKSDYPQDALAMLEDYTSVKSAAFNQWASEGVPSTRCGEGAHSVNGVRYYSWGGTSKLTNALDLLDYFFVLSGAFYSEANDGLVGRCSSHLGKVIRDDYSMNHVDAMNHLFGLHGIFTTDPKTLYRQHANRLKKAGL